MNLDELIETLKKLKKENDSGDPKVSLFVDGQKTDIKDIVYDEEIDEILISDEDLS